MEHPYLGDMLLLNILDQIWLSEVFDPIASDLSLVLKGEIRAVHQMDKLEELLNKRSILCKILKYFRKGKENQQRKNALP